MNDLMKNKQNNEFSHLFFIDDIFYMTIRQQTCLDKAFFLISFMLKESEKHQRKILMTLT